MSKINKIKVGGILYDIEDTSKEQLINEYIWDGKAVNAGSEYFSMFQEILTKVINGEDVIVYVKHTIDAYRQHLLIPMICHGYTDSTNYFRFENYVPYAPNTIEGLDIYLAAFVLYHDKNGNLTSVSALGVNNYKMLKVYDGNQNINYGALSTNNTKTYTPTSDYHPATKQYVDQAIAEAIANALASLQE